MHKPKLENCARAGAPEEAAEPIASKFVGILLERMCAKRVSVRHSPGMVVNPTDDEFRRQAEICRKTAAKAATEELKVGWLRLAAEWQSMATPARLAPGEESIAAREGNIPAGTSASRPSDQAL